MNRNKWYFVFNILLLFLAVFLLTKRLYIWNKTGEIENTKIAINIAFIVYLVYTMYKNRITK